jgi:two-component system, OmpR family, response regulator
MSKKKILVVDDEKACCEMFLLYFQKDYLVHVAYDGLKAKELLETNTYDYIFMDCNMPGLSGVELIKVIKVKNPESKKIMISGYALIDEDFAKDLGVDTFLRKPFDLEDIEKLME